MKVLLYQLDAMSRKLVAGIMDDHHFDSISLADREEALATVDSGGVGAVVADVQRDGLHFIRSIRACEGRGRHRIPLIALTIADTPSSRRQYTDAGADAVLPIPVRSADLLAVLNQSVKCENAGHTQDISGASNDRAALDLSASLERVEGDRGLLEELLRLFFDECQGTLQQIRDSWSSGDIRALGRLAHTLKGSSANVGANGVSEAAFALECLARSGSMENAVQLIADLEREIERLLPELEQFLKQTVR